MQSTEDAKRVNSFSSRKNAFMGRTARTLSRATEILQTQIDTPEKRHFAFSVLQRAKVAREKIRSFTAELEGVPYTKIARDRAREDLAFARVELENITAILHDKLFPERAAALDAAQDLEDLMSSTSSSSTESEAEK